MLLASLAALLAAGTAKTGAQSRLAALPRAVPAPADDPLTADKISLGRLLFWDPILSGGKDVACATCHHPDFGYADGLDLSIGADGIGLGSKRTFVPGHPVRFVKRNSQTLLNVAFNGITSTTEASTGRGADVLGSQGPEPRDAGARAPQSARRDARQRILGRSRAR